MIFQVFKTAIWYSSGLYKKQPKTFHEKWFVLGCHWWEEVDSNHRSRRRQIYSLIHLAALESSLVFNLKSLELVNGIEPSTC